jgi:hypothetical protein
VGNFSQWDKKSLPSHGSFSTAAPVLYAGIYLPLFYQCTHAVQGGLLRGHKSTPVTHKHMLYPPACIYPLITEDLLGQAATGI